MREKKTSGEVIEWAEFRLKAAVSEDDLLQAAPAVTKWLSQQNGFRARRLSRGENGCWVDCCFWSDMATAKAAAEEITQTPETQRFFQLLDLAETQVRHFEVIVFGEHSQ